MQEYDRVYCTCVSTPLYGSTAQDFEIDTHMQYHHGIHYRKSLGSATVPDRAEAAAVKGEAR